MRYISENKINDFSTSELFNIEGYTDLDAREILRSINN